MIQNKTIHILNGESMYRYFRNSHYLDNDVMIPFNEAMCYGKTSMDLFSQESVEVRAEVHNITPEDYINHTLKPLQPLFSGNFTNIILWFDTDMFCQINMLTLLAWLDWSNHHSMIDLHIVGEGYKPLETYIINPKGYYDHYLEVLINKTPPHEMKPGILKKGVELYLNYLNKDSDLMLYIQNHLHVPKKELLLALFEKFKDYGLGDTQYLEIIEAHQKSKS